MPNQEVNLLTFDKKREKNLGSFFTLSLLFLILVIFLSIGLLLYMLFLKTSFATVSGQESQAIARLNSLKSKKIKLLTLTERLSNIQKIVTANHQIYDNIEPIEESIPAGIFVGTITAGTNTATIILTSSSLASLNTYLNTNLKELTQKKNSKIKNISIDDFSVTDDGQYLTTLHFTF